VLARRRWGLVEEEAEAAFLAEVACRSRAWRAGFGLRWDEQTARATTNRYCEIWYVACRDAKATRQAQSPTELYEQICTVARRLGAPDESADRAQETLEQIATRLDQVRDPSSFFSWANQLARRWMIQVRRQAEAATAAQAKRKWRRHRQERVRRTLLSDGG
jgi:hypothetical protein